MNLIVAVDQNWAIGHQDALLTRIPEDLKRFRRMTLGHTLVVGRRTLATFPQGKPLPKRRTLVLSATPGFEAPGAQVCASVEQALSALGDTPSQAVFVIGGQQIYELFLPHCDTAYVTRIDAAFPADRFFPNLTRLPEWTLAQVSPPMDWEGLRFWYETYCRTPSQQTPNERATI